MHLPREVMLSQRLAKSRELWEQENNSGSFDRITVFTQRVFVTQVTQPEASVWIRGYYFLWLEHC